MTSLRDLEILDKERERSRMRSMYREVSRFLLIMCGALFLILLMAAIASAQTLERKTGWQIHIYYQIPRNDRSWDTIGPPLPSKQFCEETAFPLLIERIQDRVRCVYVDDLYVRK